EAKSSRTRSMILATGGGGASTTNQSNTPRVKRENTTTPGLSPAERETLMKEGRCFYYKEQGHMTRECPKKKPTLAAVATAPTANPARVNEIIELEGLSRKDRFEILTDHQSLEYFMTTRQMNQRQMR
ncbi:hypothetical protein PENNAL_c0628G04575, partial [Penicillium nalgiovense]